MQGLVAVGKGNTSIFETTVFRSTIILGSETILLAAAKTDHWLSIKLGISQNPLTWLWSRAFPYSCNADSVYGLFLALGSNPRACQLAPLDRTCCLST